MTAEPATETDSSSEPKAVASDALTRVIALQLDNLQLIRQRCVTPLASVYEGMEMRSDSRVLVHRVHPELLSSPNTRARLQTSLGSIMGHQGPSLPGLEDILEVPAPDRTSDPWLLVIETLPPGKSLRAILDNGKLAYRPLEVAALVALVDAIQSALDSIPLPWRHGCVVPELIFVSDPAGEGSAGQVTLAGPFLGAALPAKAVATCKHASPFFAPEVRAGLPHSTSDLYAVGAVVFEALMGRAPEPGEQPGRELGTLGNAITALLTPSPAERSDTLEPLLRELRNASELSSHDSKVSEGAEPDTTPTRLSGTLAPTTKNRPDLGRTQVDQAVPAGVVEAAKAAAKEKASRTRAATTANLATPSDPPPQPVAGKEPPEALLPAAHLRDLDPNLVRLALGADPGNRAELEPTTPGTLAADGRSTRNTQLSSPVEPGPSGPRREDLLTPTQPEQPNHEDDATPVAAQETAKPAKASATEGGSPGPGPLPSMPTAPVKLARLMPPVNAAAADAAGVPPNEPDQETAEATMERPFRGRQHALAQTMLDHDRIRVKRHRTAAWILILATSLLVAFVVVLAGIWYHGRQQDALEERRLQRKYERLQQNAASDPSEPLSE